MTRVSAAGVVTLVVALGAVACQEAALPPSLGSDDIAALQRADRIISPKLTPEESALLVNAHGAVVEACMKQLGWDYEVGTSTGDIEAGGPSTLSPLEQWTFADTAAAETVGYGFESYLAAHAVFLDRLGEGDGEAHVPDPLTMSPEDAARFELDSFGTEEERIEITERDGSHSGAAGGGCIGEAGRAVWGDIEQEMRLRDARGTAESDIWVTTFEDQAVVDALDRWKDCVREQGFEFEDPNHGFESALSAAQSGDYDQERLIATTDAECKAESGLDRAVQAAFLSATKAVLPDLEADLVALQQFEAEALARAKNILRFGED
jgi:hypothetical protein